MTTPSKTNKPTSLEGVKKEFYEKFYKPSGIEGWHIEGNIFELWSFISQQISIAEERGEKRISDEIYPRLYSLWANIDFVHNRSAREQAKELVKLLESLTHKSTKQSKEVNR